MRSLTTATVARLAAVACLLGRLLAAHAADAPAAQVNFVANPSFEVTEAPPPTPATKGRPAPPDKWLPRNWSVWPMDFAGYSLVDDPAQAHSGRRCVNVKTEGGVLSLTYGPVPRFDDKPWTVRFWARGTGQVVAAACEYLYAHGPSRLKEWTFPVTAAWSEYEFEYQPPADRSTWHLELATRGAADLWLDNVFVGHADLRPTGLPPDKPAGQDDHTLLYLPFEEPLDEYQFFIEGQVLLSKPDEGRFGKGLVLGPGGYVACSAGKYLDLSQGTIEFWVKLGSPGNDGVTHPMVNVAGSDAMGIWKDAFCHVIFAFTSGWAGLSYAWAEGYAYNWQPGVWRHIAACWDRDLMELFIDGKLVAWEVKPRLLHSTNDELGLGSAGMELDDLRISNIARYRMPVRSDGPRRNESFVGGQGKF
jgi:hypothetical protein